MDSRIFIRTATELRKEIKEFAAANLDHAEEQLRGSALQKDINAAFSGLQNPTLPTAEKLRDEAMAAGFAVNPQIVQRITQANYAWGN